MWRTWRDPNSIKFRHSADVSYVSASPHRIPIAIVAAAQASIDCRKRNKNLRKDNNLKVSGYEMEII